MAKILMVDDEEKIRFVVKEYAQFSGHEVTEAADGSQAVELLSLIHIFPLRDKFSVSRAVAR